MQFQIHQEIGARFKLVARKANGCVARETVWFKNLVLDTGLARMSVGTWIDRCCVGTGNSTPLATQISLDSFVASTTTKQSTSSVQNTSSAPYYYGASITWRFGQGVAAGNISEVGLGWSNSDLWNRALIKDANGDPTTITVLSDEYLDVVSEIRVYPAQNISGSFNLLDKTGAVISTHTFTGVPYITSGRNANFAQVYLGGTAYPMYIYTGTVGAITSTPSGTGYSITNLTKSYPTANSVRAVVSLDLNDVVATHQSFRVSSYNMATDREGYQLQISPAIPKTSAQKMTYTFELSWGRYTG